eukprot:211616-Chlamydomonas_euryale.AAC.1
MRPGKPVKQLHARVCGRGSPLPHCASPANIHPFRPPVPTHTHITTSHTKPHTWVPSSRTHAASLGLSYTACSNP